MSTPAPLQKAAAKPQQSSPLGHRGLHLQRQCACGSPTSSLTGNCEECKSKKALQAKLTIGGSNDPLEQEADRVAEQVLAAPLNSATTGVPPRIQRFSTQSNVQTETAPASVDRVLASSGNPLESTLRQDMEHRFGHDFSQVRVHSGGAAEQSAREVNANAYTVGLDIVFGTGRFAPGTREGRRLIAHELTHVMQQQSGSPAAVRRDTKPLSNAPAQSADPLRALLPQIPPEISKQFSVRAMKESEFQAMTGIKVTSIPEKRLLSPTEAGLAPESNRGALAGMGAGMLFAPRPSLPLPLGTTGVLWSAGAHLSQFAVVPQENPALAFFFGDTMMTAYGFRAPALLHIGAAVERDFDTAGGRLTAKLNRGVAGNYANDAIFPYLPVKGGSVAVHVQGGAENVPGAQELTDCMAETSRNGKLKGTYRFSTPPNKTPNPSPAFDRAFGPGKAADPNFVPPEIVNCLNKANQLTRLALSGRDLIQSINGREVNISTATFVDTGQPVPDMLPSAAKSMPPYLAQWDSNPSAQGLTRTPITAGMWLNGITGVIRVGGFVLMIVNLVRVGDRYSQATEFEKPLVVGEEATLLTAGLLGSLIGEVIGEAVLCVGTGPGVGLCVLAVGLVGGAAAVAMSGDTAQGIGKTLQDAAEMNRQGKLLPGVMEAATQVLGTEQQKKLLNDMKKTERPEPSDGLFDLFKF